MRISYRDFLCKNTDLAPLGLVQREDNSHFFCTPKGAKIIGWGRMDGIHYCTIADYGEAVFSVNPSNGAPDYVHPLAETFEDFLRLLLTCKDANVLEQAWLWDEATFHTICTQYQSSDDACAVLSELEDVFHLTPMEHPWQYINQLQQSFDAAKIAYSKKFPVSGTSFPVALPDWTASSSGTSYDKTHLSTKYTINQEFEFAQHSWKVPAVYACSQSLIIDLCMKVRPQEYQHLIQATAVLEHESLTQEQQMWLDLENPFYMELCPEGSANGRNLNYTGESIRYSIPENGTGTICTEIWRTLGRYHLDPTVGWAIHRIKFSWATKKQPKLNTLSLTMKQQPKRMPGPHFKVTDIGDTVEFALPENRGCCTLTVLDYKSEQIHYEPPFDNGMEYPSYYTEMTYSLSPELPEGSLSIHDCCTSDQPREHHPNQSCSSSPISENPLYDATIGIIGGADGPTAIYIATAQEEPSHSVCSSLHFEPAKQIEWFPIFQLTPEKPQSIQLL